MRPNAKEVGARIYLIRCELGLTLEEFGDKFEPSADKSLVSRWERGVSIPNPKRLKTIAELGQTTVSDLTKREPIPNGSSYGDRIRHIREAHGMTMKRFGNLFDPPIRASVISNWENNRNKPNKKSLDRLAYLGNTTVEFIVRGESRVPETILASDMRETTVHKDDYELIKSIYRNGSTIAAYLEDREEYICELEQAMATVSDAFVIANEAFEEVEKVYRDRPEPIEHKKTPTT